MTERNGVEIRRWMLSEGVTVSSIRDALKYKHHTIVSNTLAGRENNRKVLGYLLKKGCPKKYLRLPKDMREAA